MTIRTDRLELRPVRGSDAPSLFEFLGDAEAMQFTQSHPSLRACRRRLAGFEWQRRRVGFAAWTAVFLSDRRVIGWGGLYVDPFDQGWGPELGYAFHPDTWGQGYATELAQAALDLADGALGVAGVSAFVHPDNVASRRLLDRMGFALVRPIPEMDRLLLRRGAGPR